jgi:predicted dehydrogenase
MAKLRVGVIGVGHLGKHHARIYAQLPQVELVGVNDLAPEKAKQIAGEYVTKEFCTQSELLQEVQAVSIATSTSSHYEVARQALERGVHILIEKPLCSSYQQAEELVNLAHKKNLILQVGHIERFNPAVLALSQNLADVRPMFIEAHRLAAFTERGTDVAVVLDLMTHDLDLITSWVDSELVDIQAAGISVVTDSDDIANARLTFANGCVANITASRVSAKPMRKIRLFQKELYASLDLAEKSLELYRLMTAEQLSNRQSPSPSPKFQLPVEKLGKTIVYEKPEVKNQDMLTLQLSAFVESVQTGSRPLVDGEQGAKVVKIATQIEEQIRTQRAKVRL